MRCLILGLQQCAQQCTRQQGRIPSTLFPNVCQMLRILLQHQLLPNQASSKHLGPLASQRCSCLAPESIPGVQRAARAEEADMIRRCHPLTSACPSLISLSMHVRTLYLGAFPSLMTLSMLGSLLYLRADSL